MRLKRIISFILAMTLALSIAPAEIFAVQDIAANNPVTEGERVSVSEETEPKRTILTDGAYIRREPLVWNPSDGGAVVSSLKGSGTAESPYLISNGHELMYFAQQVNGGNTYQGDHIRLTADLDMNMIENGKTWTPVGYSAKNPFQGSFDGNGYEISNLRICYNSQKTADNEIYYVGFFGYVQNAVVKNLGIHSYVLDHKFNYDTAVGALVAKADGTTIVENCFANGEISAVSQGINPLDRADCRTVVPPYSNYISSVHINDANDNGQGVLVDLSSLNNTGVILVQINVSGDVSALKLTGMNKFCSISVTISGHDYLDFYLSLENMGPNSMCKAKVENGRRLFISGSGTMYDIEAADSEIHFVENLNMKIIASDGNLVDTSNSTKGESGNDGKAALIAKSVYMNFNGKLTVHGGNGSDGEQGAQGDTGYSYGNGSFWSSETGGAGGQGKAGGDGGKGNLAIQADNIYVNKGNVFLYGGDSGNGGKGGKGGTGGKGADASGLWDTGGNGGTGGKGGTGGTAYTGAKATDAVIHADAAHMPVCVSGKNGNPGAGGDKGDGGAGGGTDGWWWASSGSPGGKGSVGDTGSLSTDHTNHALLNNSVFDTGENQCCFVYDNAQKGVKVDVVEGQWETAYQLQITSQGGSDSRHLGGYFHAVDSAADQVYYYAVYALIPVGYTFGVYNNSIGDGGYTEYLTDRAGTGQWKWYIAKTVCGSSGTFSSLGFVAISGNNSATNVVWYVGYSSVFNSNTLKMENVAEPKPAMLSAGMLTAGGLVGILGSEAKVERCAAVVNDIAGNGNQAISLRSDIELKAKANLIAKNENSSPYSNISHVAAAQAQGQTLSAYSLTSWFGWGMDTAVFSNSVAVLNDNADSQGLVYDGDVTQDGSLAQNRTVVGKRDNHIASIQVPLYVYSGKFVGSVYHIADRAFAGHTEITAIHLGENVVSTGEAILEDCANVSTITIGKNLDTIYEMNNAQPLFGIAKDDSKLRSYQVTPGNRKFKTIGDGILYERFPNQEPDIPVAIIDVPAEVTIYDYTSTSYILRIYPYAFSYNRTIQSVKLNYVREIGTGAFSFANSLTSVAFGNYEPAEKEFVEDLAGNYYASATETYQQVVGLNAFKGCRKLNSVDLSSHHLTMIGLGAFAECKTTLSVTLGRKIHSIGANAEELESGAVRSYENSKGSDYSLVFEGTNLLSFTVDGENPYFASIDGVLYVKPNALPGCPTTEKGNLWLAIYPNMKADAVFCIPDSRVIRVCNGAFRNAANLSHLIMDSNVQKIGDYAFAGAAMQKIDLGSSVTQIGDAYPASYVFEGCNSLHEISVADSLYYTSKDGVLYNSDGSLLIKYPINKAGSEFTAPESVSQIEERAFAGNVLIRRVTFLSPIRRVGLEAFSNCRSLSIIFFKTGEAPFKSPSEVLSSRAFVTEKGSTIVCYGEQTASWEQLKMAYKSTEGRVLYTIEEFVGYPEQKISTGYYAFVVTDTSGNPLNNIFVELDGAKAEFGADDQQTIKTQAGIAMFLNLDYDRPHSLRVVDNLGAYYPVVNEEFWLDEATRITYITVQSVPVVSGVSVTYESKAGEKIRKDDLFGGTVLEMAQSLGNNQIVVDIQSQAAKINKWSIDSLDILVSVGIEAQYEILGYHIVQDNKVIHTVNSQEDLAKIKDVSPEEYRDKTQKKLFHLPVTVKTADLVDGKDVYAVVEYRKSDGKTEKIQTKLNIQLFTMDWYPINTSWASNEIAFTVDNSIPFIGGAELKLSSGVKDPPVIVAVGDDYFRMTIGGKAEDIEFGDNHERNKGDSLSEVSKNWESYINAIQSGFGNKTALFESSRDNKMGLSISGYAEWKYKGLDENNEPIIDVNSGITGVLKYTFGVGTTMQVIFVPVRLEVELTLEGNLKLELKFDDTAKEFLDPDIDIELKGSLEAYAGIGCSIASAGIYGEITTVLILDIYPQTGVKKWSLSGDMGAYVKYEGLFVKFKKTWSLFEGLGWNKETVIFENGIWFPEDSNPEKKSMLNQLYDQSNYQLATSKRSQKKQLTANDQIYEGTDPMMLQVGGEIYKIYHADLDDGINTKYDANNFQKIVYQVYSPGSGWSERKILDDNGLSDGEFEVYTDGTNTVLVYAQMKRRVESDIMEDQDQISACVSNMEIKTAVLQNGEFLCDPDALTEDDAYDMYIRIGRLDGKITAVWVKNTNNSMYGVASQEKPSAICMSVFTDGQWSAPVTVAEDLGTVTGIAVNEDYILYITDANNNLMTAGTGTEDDLTDRFITLIDSVGTVVAVSDQQAAYHNATVYEDQLAYYREGNLYTVSQSAGENGTVGTVVGTVILTENVQTLPEKYEIVYDSKGNAKAILFVKNESYGEDSSAGSNLYGIFCENEDWGEPIQLTDYGVNTYVSAFDAVDQGDGMYLSVLLTQLRFIQNSQDEFQNYETVNTLETNLLTYPTGYKVDKLDYNYETIEKDKKTTIHVYVTSESCSTIREIPVTVTYQGSVLYSGTATEFYDYEGNRLPDGLPSGCSGYAAFRMDPGPVSNQPHTISSGDYSQKLQLWKSDLAVFGKQVKIGSEDYIVAYVTNMGDLPAPVALTVSYQGQPVCPTIHEDALNYQDVRYFTIPISNLQIQPEDALVILDIGAADEYSLVNNTDEVIITNSPEKQIQVDSLQVQTSLAQVQVRREAPVNFAVTYDKAYALQYIRCGNEVLTENSGLFTVGQGYITFYGEKLTDYYANGVYEMWLHFDERLSDTPLTVTVTEYYTVEWIVDGQSTIGSVEQGTVPVFTEPVKEADHVFSYTFAGWDSNNDGEADAMQAISGPATYVAVFNRIPVPYTVTWVLPDGVEIAETYTYGQQPVYSGETPVKSPDVCYDYSFAGWDKELAPVTADAVYTAVFTQSNRMYDITLVVGETQTVIQAPYGTVPILPNPEIASDNQYHYVFKEWSPAISVVSGEQTYTAVFENVLQQYTVSWVIDGVTVEQQFHYGQMPAYSETPQKAPDAQYTYSFAQWEPALQTVTGDASYTAVFDKTVNQYTVSWVVADRIYEQQVAYGQIPVFEGNLTKNPDDIYKYAFDGWDRPVTAVTGDTSYTACYRPVRKGTAQITNTVFQPHWGETFVTTVSLQNIQGISDTYCVIGCDAALAEILDVTAFDGVTVVEKNSYYVKLQVDELQDKQTKDLVTLTMKTADSTPYGDNDLFAVQCEDELEAQFTPLTVCHLGTVRSWGLTLGDDLTVNFVVEIQEAVRDTAQVKITADGKTVCYPINQAQYNTEKGGYIFSVSLAAAQMNDIITVEIANQGDNSRISQYTINQYARYVLAQEDMASYHWIVKEMLNYGAMAQVYFDYDAENLVNDGITGVGVQAVPTTTESSAISGKSNGMNFYGASLVFRDRIAVRFYFTGDVNGCTFAANGNTYTPVAKDGLYYVDIPDILPQNLDQQILFTVTDADGSILSVTYGPMNYIVRMNEKGSAELQNLLKALYNYHLAVKAIIEAL